MFKATGILLALVAIAAAGTIHVVNDVHEQTAHYDVATKQKAILHLFVHVHQPTVYDEIAEVAQKWDIVAHSDHYANSAVVKHWADLYVQGTLPKGEIFHVHNDVHLDEAVALFDLFYFSNDFDTFLKTAAWAREHVNEGQFVYALSVAVLHRPDCHGLELPPLYEIYPHFYLSSTDIQTFIHAKMRGYDHYTAKTNFSGLYDVTNPEMVVSYFTEDVGLNAYHAYAHLYNPFWMKHEKYGTTEKGMRGENFYYFYQQLLAYYNLNRMSAYLPQVEDFDWEENVVKPGYYPELHYHSGQYFPARPDDYPVSSINSYTIADIKAIEYRIKDAIDSGFVVTKEGSKVSISHHLFGINVLGNIVEGNKDSVNSRYYGSYYSMLRNLFALIMDPTDKHGVAPGPIAHYETALRDPAFYVFIKYINDFFVHYKSNLPAYKSTDLYFSGVQVKDVQVDDLVTYFDHFEVDVTNAVKVAHHEEASKVNFVAQVPRLNHKPFAVKIKVVSDKKTNAVVRVFLGPKAEVLHSNFFGDSNVEAFGHQTYDLDQLRHHFVELDRFPVTIDNGVNTIVRKSHEFASTVGDHVSFKDLLHQVESGTWTVSHVDTSCGFPDRLALPMGHINGMPYTVYVVVTPYGAEHETGDYTSGPGWTDTYDINVQPVQTSWTDDYQHQTVHVHNVPHYCNGVMKVFDGHSQGFPFDREIHSFNKFYTPNMYFKDVHVFHKNTTEDYHHHYEHGQHHHYVSHDF